MGDGVKNFLSIRLAAKLINNLSKIDSLDRGWEKEDRKKGLS